MTNQEIIEKILSPSIHVKVMGYYELHNRLVFCYVLTNTNNLKDINVGDIVICQLKYGESVPNPGMNMLISRKDVKYKRANGKLIKL